MSANGSRSSGMPSEVDRIAHDLKWRARWQGLESDGIEERAKQLVQQGGRKPRFTPAPK